MLGLVHEGGVASRADLTTALGLNRSTVGDLVATLAAAGLVVEDRPDAGMPGRVGRPSLVVRPHRAPSAVAAYVDIGRLRVVRVGLGGLVLARREVPLPPDVPAPVAAAMVADLTMEVLPAGAARERFVGVGVAVPGTVHADRGIVATAPNLGWSDVPLGAQVAACLAERFGRAVGVGVANDADLGALAERLRGAGRGCTDVVYLCGTYGLGGGVISGGHPLTGSRGFAGEVGHLSVDPAGRACRCGSRGCWESEAQAVAWAEPLDLDPDHPDIAALVLHRLDGGGVAARRTRDKLSRSFARGLASIVNLFDPQVVLLGDGLWRDLWPAVAQDVMPWVHRLVMPALRDGLSVCTAGLQRDSTLFGAAELAFGTLLADPLASSSTAVPATVTPVAG